MNRDLIKEGNFHLVSEEPCRIREVICFDRWYISDKYGHKLREIRAISNDKLYHIAIAEYNNNKILPVNVLLQDTSSGVRVQGFGADVPSAGCSLDINKLSSYRDMINRTIKFISMLNKYYKGV